MVHQVHQVTDVTPLIWVAWDHHQDWCRPLVVALLDKLHQRFEGSRMDWEPGDEEWGRLLLRDQNGILVCSRMPLVIIESAVLSYAQPDLPDEVVALSVPSLDTPVLKIDRRVVGMMFGWELSDNVAWDQMSANDFWWATV